MALAALERIKTVLVKSGQRERLGEPLSMKELAAQAELLGTELPPSYVAAMRVSSRIGEPERFLSAQEMAVEAERIVAFGGEEAKRYAPFCKGSEHVVCFDNGGGRRLASSIRHEGELPIIEWRESGPSPAAAHFGEWLDSVADARDEAVEIAAKMPPRLKRLLYELGFRFEYPVVGHLETGDTAAVAELAGRALEREIRGEVDRLFDASGKASLTLNVDEFTLTAQLRTGAFVFEAEDVFRWLRTFRDENFFTDEVANTSRPDTVRDLRRAPREPPIVRRGVVQIASAPSRHLLFRAASGATGDDFYLLGSSRQGGHSSILHVVDGGLATSHDVDEPLEDLHVAYDGALWGLTSSYAVRLTGGHLQRYPLRPQHRHRPRWHGIGGGDGRVLVWGVGALLEFDGEDFVPFAPDARLDESESIVAVHARGLRIWMLVCGESFGAVARFDSVEWAPISNNDVIDGALLDFDAWRGTSVVLDRGGNAWKVDDDGLPRPLGLDLHHQAFSTDDGARRPLHGVSAFDGGLLFASDGGVISLTEGEPLFHAISPAGGASSEEGDAAPVRLVRVGGRATTTAREDARDEAIVALAGPSAWVWRGRGRDGAFRAIDLHEG